MRAQSHWCTQTLYRNRSPQQPCPHPWSRSLTVVRYVVSTTCVSFGDTDLTLIGDHLSQLEYLSLEGALWPVCGRVIVTFMMPQCSFVQWVQVPFWHHQNEIQRTYNIFTAPASAAMCGLHSLFDLSSQLNPCCRGCMLEISN